jgi:hypothetical protein
MTPGPPKLARFPVLSWWVCALAAFMAADAVVFAAAL